MFDFKILIVRDEQFILQEFEIHHANENVVKDIVESYMNNFNDDCKAFIFFTV